MKESKISLINLQEQGKSMSNYTRMFRGKMRMSTCRIILITSLAWLLIDVIIIMKYTDGLGGGIFKKSHENEVNELEPILKNWEWSNEISLHAESESTKKSKKCINCFRIETQNKQNVWVNYFLRNVLLPAAQENTKQEQKWKKNEIRWLSRWRLNGSFT